MKEKIKNKLLIIESGDNLGKTSLIEGLCKHFNYKNIIVRHCDKPLKNLSLNEVLDFQFKCFEQEFQMVKYIQGMNRKFMYHDNIIIYDRFYLGEYVYGHLFRNQNISVLKNKILTLEEKYIKSFNWCDVYLITLTAEPEFFLKKEDGNSFSQDLLSKTKELELFKEVYEFSIIKNKLIIKVDENGIFRGKYEILSDVLDFIKPLN